MTGINDREPLPFSLDAAMPHRGKLLSAALLAAVVAAAGSACSQEMPATPAAGPSWQKKVDHRLLESAAPAGQALSPLPPPVDGSGRQRIVVTLTTPLDDSCLQALHDRGFLEEAVAADRLQVQGRIAAARLPSLAMLDFVRWIAPVQPPLRK